MVNIQINNRELSVAKDLTILQAASLADIQIPRFCYHEKLTIAGNCRMCLVEVAKVNKPVASCALPVSEGMQVYTNTILVKKAREGVLELLLANHPLDCPICDQGGECDLQEQAMIFGNDRSRFYENKRAVSDKTISPFIKTIMTRCIHCTRCVRFLNEIGGVNELGMTGRGSASEIGTYVQNSISSELSGNVIDLCPVGALTSKPYAFTARPWELRSTETIDIMDFLGTNIKVDTRGPNIMRVLPKINEEINEEWITDKTRFSFDGYKSQRLNTPMYSQRLKFTYKLSLEKNGNFTFVEFSKNFFNCSWEEAFLIFNEFFCLYKKENNITNIVFGNNINIESNILLKKIKKDLAFDNLVSQRAFDFSSSNSKLSNFSNNIDIQSSYLLNISPSELEKVDSCLLVGTNIRLENPLLNSRLRKAFLSSNAKIASIGPTIDSLYNLKKLGNSLSTLVKILEGKHSYNSSLLNARKALIIFGNSFSSDSLLSQKLNSFINNLKIKNKNFSNITIGFINKFIGENIDSEFNTRFAFIKKSAISKENSFNFLINSDEITYNKIQVNNSFFVYQGFQADRSAYNSDLVFPQASPIEEVSSYFDVNNEVCATNICLPAPLGSRTSWKILAALHNSLFPNKSNFLNLNSNHYNKRVFSSYNVDYALFDNVNQISLKISRKIINNSIANYYKTNSITRNSRVMSQITKQKVSNIRY